MNKLSIETRAAIVRGLVEGASIRGISRMVGVDKETVTNMLCEIGEFAEVFQHHALTNLKNTKVVELDEIWSYVSAKEGNKTREGQGDLWTFTAIDADSKLVFSWLVGSRTNESTIEFCRDVASRLPNRVQVTTDANWSYRHGITAAFGVGGADFAQLIKRYATVKPEERRGRYAPTSICTSVSKSVIFGNPDMDRVSTSYVERQNLQMRMNMRRFTRLTNAFSKKAQNHAHAVALHYLVYNYVRPHGTLSKEAGRKVTPAMAAGVADRVMTVEDFLEMMEPTFSIGRAA